MSTSVAPTVASQDSQGNPINQLRMTVQAGDCAFLVAASGPPQNETGITENNDNGAPVTATGSTVDGNGYPNNNFLNGYVPNLTAGPAEFNVGQDNGTSGSTNNKFVFVVVDFQAQPPASRPVTPPVTLESLLADMVNRDTIATWPNPTYTAKEFTSTSPASVAPNLPGWYANNDSNNFIRTENNGNGVTEYVMMDVDGPGAVVEFSKATTDPNANLRIYLDNSTTPITVNERYLLGGAAETDEEYYYQQSSGSQRFPSTPCNQETFLGGFGTIPRPLAGCYSLGCDLYLPIPYARHIKITYDGNTSLPCYYKIAYRTYAPGSQVQTFSLAELNSDAALIKQTCKQLLAGAPGGDPVAALAPSQTQTLSPGANLSTTLSGPAAINQFSVSLNAANLNQALRSTVLAISFDGSQTVWAPVGDFFASGIGVHAYQGWSTSVAPNGTMTCNFVMPFATSATVQLINLGNQNVTATLGQVQTENWTWSAGSSMYFHATWHHQGPFPVQGNLQGTEDFNYLTASGTGVVVGDSLIVHNSAVEWWGEGDEKIYVDGETFPSQFGTGTEDYYGYSRGGTQNVGFSSPFLSHPQVAGDLGAGYTALNRMRALDGISFTDQIKFDMEVEANGAAQLEYASTTYWYALQGATTSLAPDPAGAGQALITTDSPQPELLSATSSQVHGQAGTFALPLQIFSGFPTTETRLGSPLGSYSFALNFNVPISSATASLATQANATGTVSNIGVGSQNVTTNGSTVIVNVTGVADAQRINLHVQPAGGDPVNVPVNLLWGDVNGDGVVNILDLLQVRLHSGQALTPVNFQHDLNCDGAINILDLIRCRKFSGTSLP